MLLAIPLLLCSLAITVSAQGGRDSARVLLFSATAAFRHDSIPTAIRALQANAQSINVTFDSTEDGSLFTTENLDRYDAVVFLSNTGEVLNDSGKAALQTYLNQGGAFVGIHAASDCLRSTPFFVRAIGAKFDNHADLQEAVVNVIGPAHPTTANVPAAWRIRDEMYNFESDPRSIGATVVLAADETSYVDNKEHKFDHGDPHPIAWFQDRNAGVEGDGATPGRSFYTSLGHLNETWQDETFVSHVLSGIDWVLQSSTSQPVASAGSSGSSSMVPVPSASASKGTNTSSADLPNVSDPGSSNVAVLTLPLASLVVLVVVLFA